MNAEKSLNYSNTQITMLVILRVLVGWHFLYEGVAKVLNPNWTSVGYLLDSKGFMTGFFNSLASNPEMLKVIDLLNIWGLVAIGLALILGSFTRVACIAGISLLAFYYLSHPPFIGLKFAAPGEGSYLFVNKNLIEIFALAVIMVFPTSQIIGLDRLIFFKKSPQPAH